MMKFQWSLSLLFIAVLNWYWRPWTWALLQVILTPEEGGVHVKRTGMLVVPFKCSKSATIMAPLGFSASKGPTARTFAISLRARSWKKSVSINVLLWNWSLFGLRNILSHPQSRVSVPPRGSLQNFWQAAPSFLLENFPQYFNHFFVKAQTYLVPLSTQRKWELRTYLW